MYNLELRKLYFEGRYRAVGGTGGIYSEHGAAGTVYLHKLPLDQLHNLIFDTLHLPSIISTGLNRTLYIDNDGRQPRDIQRNLTSAYADYTFGTSVTWVIPDTNAEVPLSNGENGLIFDHLKIFGGAQVAIVRPDAPTSGVKLEVAYMEGDRSGRFHLGFNQSLYIGSGQIPCDMSVYRGADITLLGELRAAGVTITVEGILKNVENMTIVDGGK